MITATCRTSSVPMLLVFVTSFIQGTWAASLDTPKHQGGKDLSIGTCINQTEKTVRLNCGIGFMIRINELIYGHGSQCGYSAGDCYKLDTETSLPCIGRPSCDINLPSGEYGRKLPNCDLYSTYLQVNYQCIPVTESYDICKTQHLQRQWAYIHTPRYPNNYDHHTNCSLHLLLQQDQKIRLHVLDFDLEPGSNNDCSDDLYIDSPLNSQTMCGVRRPGLFTSHENRLSLTFNSNNQGHNKGFWLYYEADPLRPDPTTTISSSTTTTTNTAILTTTMSKNNVRAMVTSQEWLPPPSHSTQTQSASQSQVTTTVPPSTLPIAAIVGGVLGALLFILLILVILIVCRSVHNKKEKEKEVIYSNKANYLNSKVGGGQLQGTPGPYIQNNLNLKSNHMDEDKLYYKDELVHKV